MRFWGYLFESIQVTTCRLVVILLSVINTSALIVCLQHIL